VPLTAHAFITPEGLLPRMKRVEGAEDDIERRIDEAINGCASFLERVTRRRLKARNYRTATTTTVTFAASSTQVVGNAFDLLEVGDDILSLYAPVGAQIASIDSFAILQMTRKAAANESNRSVTFGSEPITLSGDGTSELYCPEFPLVELFAAYYKNTDGSRTAIDTDNAVLERSTGRIRLMQDIFPVGSMNIDLEVRAGYVAPSTTSLGHQEWYDLEALSFRVAEIFFADALNLRGRTENMSVGAVSASFGLSDMPADVQAGVRRFMRLF